MKTRAVFPFDPIAPTTPTTNEIPDPAGRKAGTKYDLPAGLVIRAPVSCIARFVPATGGLGQLRLAPTSPLELTAKLPRWSTIGVDAFILEGLDGVIASVADTLTKRPSGNAGTVPRKTIPAGKVKAESSDGAQWAAGAQAVYLERGAAIWTVPTGGLAVCLSVVVATGVVEVLLDGDALLSAVAGAAGFPASAGPPSGFSFGTTTSTLHGVGSTAATGSRIETVTCTRTGVEVHGPPLAPVGAIPADLVFLSPGAGPVDFALPSGSTATWTAVVSDGTALTTPVAPSSAVQLELTSGWWGSRPSSVLTATVTATYPDASTASVTVPVLEHAPVSDSGRASRTDIPASAGSPRVSILVSDLPPTPQITTFGTSTTSIGVTVNAVAATDVTVAPTGDRLFFAAPALPAASYDLVVTIGGVVSTVANGLTYTDDIIAGLEGLKASLAVAAEEAALIAETFSNDPQVDELRVCCESVRWHVSEFQLALASVGDAIVGGDVTGEAAWAALVVGQADLIVDLVNGALASLDSPPLASLDGQPTAGADEEPDYDVDAFVIALTSLDNVVIRTSHALEGN